MNSLFLNELCTSDTDGTINADWGKVLNSCYLILCTEALLAASKLCLRA